MMSLGAGAQQASGWPNAMSREEVSMATLEVGTTLKAATNLHCHTERSVEILTKTDTYLKVLMKTASTQQGGVGGEGA